MIKIWTTKEMSTAVEVKPKTDPICAHRSATSILGHNGREKGSCQYSTLHTNDDGPSLETSWTMTRSFERAKGNWKRLWALFDRLFNSTLRTLSTSLGCHTSKWNKKWLAFGVPVGENRRFPRKLTSGSEDSMIRRFVDAYSTVCIERRLKTEDSWLWTYMYCVYDILMWWRGTANYVHTTVDLSHS